MKTFFAVFLLFATVAYEACALETVEIFGTVTSVDYRKNKFSVKDGDGRSYDFTVNGETDIDIKNQNYMQDRYYQFSDMRTGDWVQVEYFPSGAVRMLADEIDVYR